MTEKTIPDRREFFRLLYVVKAGDPALVDRVKWRIPVKDWDFICVAAAFSDMVTVSVVPGEPSTLLGCPVQVVYDGSAEWPECVIVHDYRHAA